MATEKSQLLRMEIPFFDGINNLVGDNISKKQELSHAENARSETIGVIEKRGGYRRLGNQLAATANYGLVYFDDSNASSVGFFRVSKVSDTVSIYYLNTSSVWTALSVLGTNLNSTNCSFTIAENCLFMANGGNNRYVSSNGTTVVDSSTATGHLKNSPSARKINFYKDRLYVGDYYIGTTRYKTGIMRSSGPVGIVSLVSGDHAAGVTTIEVTDTKYIHTSDSLDVYRGGSNIETLTVTAKTESSITVNATANAIDSSNELWVAGTYTGTRVFRWANNAASGVDVLTYDTFKLTGAENDRIKMMTNVANVMLIANNNNMAIWDNYNLQNLDLGIGCVSDNGYVKALGTLYFIHYKGIYASVGGRPKLISAKIEKYIKGATTTGLEATAAGQKGLNIFFHIGTVTLTKPDGSDDKTLTNTVLEYNIRQENWYVHTGINAKMFATYISSSDPDRLEFAEEDDVAGAEAFVHEFLHGTADDLVTSDVEIPIRIDSQAIYLSKQFENFCYPKQINIETEGGSDIKCFISLDGGQWYQIQGTARKGCQELKVTPPPRETAARCRQLRLSIREYSKSICRILRVAIIYATTSEQETHSN